METEIESNLPEDTAQHEAEEKKLLDFAANALDAVQTREKEFAEGWWKTAEQALDLYCASKDGGATNSTPYNILYSNTEVLLPSLYSATPKPDIRGRFKGAQIRPLSELVERFLTVAADPGHPGQETFDGALSDAVLSALVPGLGYVRLRYVEEQAFPLVYESGHYKTLIWGKAPRWAKVPWIAFKHQMTKEQMAQKFELSPEKMTENYKPSAETDKEEDDNSCCVYEFWDKATKRVYFLCDEWVPKLLHHSDDPLGLAGFYPTPGLLLLTAKPGRLSPTPLYQYYKNQAEELNRVSVRLNKVLSAIRVRGAYSSLLGDDIAKLLGENELENELVPASETAALAQNGGFDRMIWMLPIEKLIIVAQELYKAREAIKQVIYELTGISDIIRGSSVASETATAQDLKAKWGTVRLRKMQKLVADYARDLFRMTVDCGTERVPAELWKTITQTALPLQQEKMVAMQQQQYQQQAMPPGQPPSPPDPKLMQVLQSPTIEELLAKIKSDANRTFVINIQTNSTIDLDTASDKAEVGEYMNAMGQLMSGVQVLMALGPTGVEAAKAMLVGVSQRFKFGLEVGEAIAAIQPPPPQPPEPKGPPPPSPEEQQVAKAKADAELEKIALDRQVLQARAAFELEELRSKTEQLQINLQAARLQLQAKQANLRAPGVK